MKKFNEKLKNIFKNKIFISILLLTLCIFPLLSGLNGSKTGDIKANALSAPLTKTLDLNGIRYEYQTSLNELKNKYGLFNELCNATLFTFVNNQEGETYISYKCTSTEITTEQKNNIANKTKDLFKFNFINDNSSYNYNTIVDNSFDSTNVNIDLIDIDDLDNIDKITINFQDFKNLDTFNSSVYNLNKQVNIFFYYLPRDIDFDIEDYEQIQENCIIQGFSLSKAINFTFDLPKYPNYSIQNIICSLSSNSFEEEFKITTEQFDNVINSASINSYTESLSVLSGLSFIENPYCNIISYFAESTEDTGYPIFQGNVLLSTTKYDEALFSSLSSPTYIDPVYQSIGRGFFGGYNEEKLPQYGFYYRNIVAPAFGGAGAFLNKQGDPTRYRRDSLFFAFDYIDNTGFTITYNNQNQLLYLQDMENLRADFDNKKYSGLSAQVDNILYNVTLVGDVNQIEQDNDIKDDFVNLLKTSALGTFFGLIWGLFTGNPALGAVIGGSIGALLGVIPLIIDALQSLVGSSPALSTIYNLFKSITMLFVDIFDAIINFALKFITNPIVLILVVVGILVYIFVIRKFKK